MQMHNPKFLVGIDTEQRQTLFTPFPTKEPCSALMDLRRWSDRRTLRGLRWLLRAVYLDYPELCTRVAQDRKRPVELQEQEKHWKSEKVGRKNKRER